MERANSPDLSALPLTRVFVVGDVHTCWHVLNRFISIARPRAVLCCGDFGVWPNVRERVVRRGLLGELREELRPVWRKGFIRNGDCPVLFCDGNHEDFDYLMGLVDRFGRKSPIEVLPNVFYCPRGCVVEVSGVRVLFFGGALSPDKDGRAPGVTWFPEEVPSEEDLAFALENAKAFGGVDAVVSHTAPRSFPVLERFGLSDAEDEDETRDVLDELLKKLSPRLWFFAHYHERLRGRWKNTFWFCLNYEGMRGWSLRFYDAVRKAGILT